MRQFIHAVAAAVTLTACAPSPGSFHGSPGGLTLDVKESLFLGNGGAQENPNMLFLLMTDRPGLCDAIRSGNTLEDMTYFRVHPVVTSYHGQYFQPRPGNYPVIPNLAISLAYAHASLERTDSACQTAEIVEGTGGTITLDGYEPKPGGRMTGSFAVTFGTDAEPGTGDFDALYCDAFDSWSLTPGCQ